MRQLLSSRWTFVSKYVFPAIWIPGFGIGVVVTFLNPRTVLYNGVKGAAPEYIGFVFLGAWLIGSAFILYFTAPLKLVSIEGEDLVVSNYRQEWRVPLASISHVTQNRWLNLRPIAIHFREETPFGRTAVFMPPTRWRVLFWSEDPEVEELRRRAGLVVAAPPS
jgi:hypothetical protein